MNRFDYYVNNVKQTFFRRIYPTKTFKIIAIFILSQTILLVGHKISFETWYQLCTHESLLILLRAVLTKVELSNHAANPNIENVVVEAAA